MTLYEEAALRMAERHYAEVRKTYKEAEAALRIAACNYAAESRALVLAADELKRLKGGRRMRGRAGR